MNSINVFGRLTTDVQIKNVAGRNVAEFGVAAKNLHKNTEKNDYDSNFYRVNIWGVRADTAAKLLRKGSRVCVSGQLVFRQYVGSDGQNHYSLDISNADFYLVDTKAETEARVGMAAPGTLTGGAAYAAPAAAPAFTPVETPEELPF